MAWVVNSSQVASNKMFYETSCIATVALGKKYEHEYLLSVSNRTDAALQVMMSPGFFVIL